MKTATHIAAALLGLLFIVFGANFFLNFLPMPMPPEGSPAALFFGALAPTGYLALIKVLEITGGVLVLIPRTRAIALLLLGPIVVNILAFQVFFTGGAGLTQPPVLAVAALSAFVLLGESKRFLKLL